MGNPIVYFELAGPDGGALRGFYSKVFDWSIDNSMTIAADSTSGTHGGIRQDPADKVFYIGVDDVTKTLADIEAAGGTTLLARTVVPDVVTFGLFRDPASNLLGLAEFGTYPT